MACRYRIWIGLGSNLGDRKGNISAGLEKLNEGGIRILRVSSLFETDPVGEGFSAPFRNGVCEAETEWEPEAMLALLLATEVQLGRDRNQGRDRTLDLDLLLVWDRFNSGQWLIRSEPPILPHPRMFERSFVLEPLQELLDYDTINAIRNSL